MKIAVTLKADELLQKEVLITEIDKSFEELKNDLIDDYIVTNDAVIKSSEIIHIKKLD